MCSIGKTGGPVVDHQSVLPDASDTICDRPVWLVKYEHFKYTMDNVKGYFSTRGFQDMHLAVIAVTGRNPKGKASILNYLLRYANFRYVFDQYDDEWLHEGELPCDGWKWKEEEKILGIGMWSDFFTFQTAQKTTTNAILILGTEGITKANADTSEAHAILALAALCSSVQIHTIQATIQEDDLDDGELATMYATMIANKAETNKVNKQQQLICIVNDWPPNDNTYGGFGFAAGWEYFLDKGKHRKKVTIQDHIKDYYSDFRGFLMPKSGAPDGGLKTANATFKQTLKEFIVQVLDPENVKIKTYNGMPLRVGDFFKCLQLWVAVLNGPEAPIVHLSYNTSVNLQTMIAKEAAYRAYNRYMIDVFSSRRHIPKGELDHCNQRALQGAMASYDRVAHLNSKDPYPKEILREELALLYATYTSKNQHRKTWYYLVYNALNQSLQDTSYIVWFAMLAVYYALKMFMPQSRFVLVVDNNFNTAARTFVITYLAYMLYNVVLRD